MLFLQLIFLHAHAVNCERKLLNCVRVVNAQLACELKYAANTDMHLFYTCVIFDIYP